MNSIVLSYPKNNIYIKNSDKYKEIFTVATHDKKLYLVNTYCYNKKVYREIRVVLGLKNKDIKVLSIQNYYPHLKKLIKVNVNTKYLKKYVIK